MNYNKKIKIPKLSNRELLVTLSVSNRLMGVANYVDNIDELKKLGEEIAELEIELMKRLEGSETASQEKECKNWYKSIKNPCHPDCICPKDKPKEDGCARGIPHTWTMTASGYICGVCKVGKPENKPKEEAKGGQQEKYTSGFSQGPKEELVTQGWDKPEDIRGQKAQKHPHA